VGNSALMSVCACVCRFAGACWLKPLPAGLVGAPACGDVMKLQIKVGEDGKIQEAVFKVLCPFNPPCVLPACCMLPHSA